MESTSISTLSVVNEIVNFISPFKCVFNLMFDDDSINIEIHLRNSPKITGYFVARINEICEQRCLSQVDVLSDPVPYLKIQFVR